MTLIGPVFPYRGAISLSTVELGRQLRGHTDLSLVSFSRQFPKRFYPGGNDIDETVRHLAPEDARYSLDVLNPFTWIREGLRLRRVPPDVLIIVWWVWIWAIPYLTICLFLRRSTRVIVQCHNIGDKEPKRWKSFLANRVLARADTLVVHSAKSVEEVRERLGERTAKATVQLFLPVLAIGTDIPSTDDARRVLGIEASRVALFFGNIRPFKGLDLALKAWKAVSADVLLLVVGEIWFGDEARYQRIVDEEGIAGRVRFETRYIPDAEVANWFAASDVIIAPYRYENQSGVAMSAFYFGKPVIATAVGGLPDIINDGVNGILIAPEDPAALAAAVDRYFENADRRALALGARASAQKYSWDRYGSVLLGIIEEA
ncbi:MAG: glycosyltransferase family 4 protein [Acidobacteriota bacterium]